MWERERLYVCQFFIEQKNHGLIASLLKQPNQASGD